MGHIFISYAREDSGFIERLAGALRERGLECWVDQKNIPPSAEWSTEVQHAMSEADALVFVISPASLQSQECRRELDYASLHHKRIIPVVVEEPREQRVPDTLATLQWLFVQDASNVAGIAEAIHTAISTDLERLRLHARLLVRAQDWVTKGRDSGVLLRGKDLREAADWLETIGNRSPQPTTLQTELILRSQRTRTRTQAILLSSLMVAIVALSALSVLAWRGTRLAEQRLALANGRYLVGTARNALRSEPDDSLLLAAEAVAIVDSLGARESEDARGALWEVLARHRRIRYYLYGLEDESVGLVFDRKSGILFGADGDSILRWDPQRRQPLGAPVERPGNAREQLPNTFWDLALSPGTHRAAVATAGARVLVFDLDSGENVATFDLRMLARVAAFSVRSVAYDSTGTLLAVGACDPPEKQERLLACGPGVVVLIDTVTGKVVQRVTLPTSGVIRDIAFHPGSHRLGVATEHGELVVVMDWKTASSSLSGLHCESAAQVVAFREDGRELAVGCANGRLLVWPLDQTTVRQLRPGEKAIRSLTYDPSGHKLALGTEDGRLQVIDLRETELVMQERTEEPIVRLAFDGSGHTLFSATEQGRIMAWSLEQESELALELATRHVRATAAALSRSGRRLAIGWDDGRVDLWTLDTSKPPERHTLPEQVAWVSTLAFDADEKQLAAGGCHRTYLDGKLCAQGAVRLWNLEAPSTSRVFTVHEEAVSLVHFVASQELVTSGDGTLKSWAPDAGPAASRSLDLDENAGANIAIPMTEGRTLAVTGYFGEVAFVDVASWREAGARLKVERPVNTFAVSPDGRHIAASSVQGTVLWQRTGTTYQASTLWPTHSGTLAFTADGRELFAEPEKGHFIRWGLESKQVVTDYRIPADLSGAILVPSQDRLVTWDDSVIIWNLTPKPKLWRALACRIANRPFRDDEIRRFLGDAAPVGCADEESGNLSTTSVGR